MNPKKEGVTDMGRTRGLCQRDNTKVFLPGLPMRVKCEKSRLSKHRARPRRHRDLVIFLLSSTGYSLEAYANSRPRQEIKCVSLTSAAAYSLVSLRCNISLDLPDRERAGRFKGR